MLRWPQAEALTPVARNNIERLRASGAARELEDDPHEWRFEMWSWTDEPEVRFTVRNELDEERWLKLDGDGHWEWGVEESRFVRNWTPERVFERPPESDGAPDTRRFTSWLRRTLHPHRTSTGG